MRGIIPRLMVGILGCAGAGLLGCASVTPEPHHYIPPACADFAVFHGENELNFRESTSQAMAMAYSAGTYSQGVSRLADLRNALARPEPHTRRISLSLREPITGRQLQARGAVALSPPQALRMIMLGPGGTTAMDLWLRDEKFRFSIPALDLLVRGKVGSTVTRGFPVNFLYSWLLHPAEGELLWYERRGGADRFALRDPKHPEAILELCTSSTPNITPAKHPIVLRRSTWAPSAPGETSVRLDEELIIAEDTGCADARYAQASTGLTIEIRCEGEEHERTPNPKAFADPDGLEKPAP